MNKQPNFSARAPSDNISPDEMSQKNSATPDLAELVRGLLIEIEPALEGSGQRDVLCRAHSTAIKNWLGKCHSSADVFEQANVQGYQEAYYHLREIGAWRQALSVMRVSLRVQRHVADQKWHQFKRTINDEQ